MLVAQISDIHAGPANDSLDRLARAIGWLKAMRPDIVVVTGDLVDDRWHQGYGLVAAALQRLDCRCLILPGNADDKSIMRAAMPDIDHGVGDSAMHFAYGIGEALLIGLDTCVDGEAHGDVTTHLPWLRQALAGGLTGAPLLFTHHHVFACGISPLDAVMCRGTDALAGLLSSGVRTPLAICSGHVHRAMSSLLAGIPAHICGSICPANPLLLDPSRQPPVTDPPALMIHDLRGGHLVSSHVSV